MAKKKKAAHQEEEAGEAWLLPYSDLMTLLLAVFIVLFAVSKMDATKAQAISQEFTQSMMTEGFAEAKAAAAAAAAAAEGESGGEAASPTTIDENALEEFLGDYELSKLEELKSDLDKELEGQGLANAVTQALICVDLSFGSTTQPFLIPAVRSLSRKASSR